MCVTPETVKLTLSTSWYNLGDKSKYSKDIYIQWIHSYLNNIKNFNLVIYTNKDSLVDVQGYVSENIKIVIRELSEFYGYQYRDFWINNHERNELLKNTCWELNMLWSEKIHFVNSTIDNQYFDTEWYGWCDIGYFRGRPDDITIKQFGVWPDANKIETLDNNKIHYACVRPSQVPRVFRLACNLNEIGLPDIPLPSDQVTIGGGFFLIQKSMISWWHQKFYETLRLYINNNYLVKDDQMILASIIPNTMDKFQLYAESDPRYDNWFMFQRILLK